MSGSLTIESVKQNAEDSGGALGVPPLALQCNDAENGQSKLVEFCASAKEAGADKILAELEDRKEIQDFLAAVFDLSPYLSDLAIRFPNTVQDCLDLGFHPTLDGIFTPLLAVVENEADVMRQLRFAKRQAALVCGLADLGGWWSAAEVSRQISRTADLTLQAAVRFVLLHAHRQGKLVLPEESEPEKDSGYSVIAMGKHGADELNYSSDIDIIVFVDPDAKAVIDRDESVGLFVRLTKSLVKIMQERTEDGYVFRTDLRLRPDPGSMPLAVPFNVAMNYYESRGQNWERAALIKARAAAGDRVVGAAILDELVPFIWRRYLDYAAIADIHSIKRQIQSHRGFTALKVPGHNLKLGRGGIREIEFFVQTQQLIAGGRIPELRGRRTVEMLAALSEHGWIEEAARDELSSAYSFLRDVEHRLQMIADAQTHTLPEDEEGLLIVAQLCGFESTDAFSNVLIAHLERVEAHYGDLFSDAPELSEEGGNLSFTGDDDDPGTIETLKLMGFEHPSKAIGIVRSWHFGRYPAMQSSGARERLTELTPALLKALSEGDNGDDALLAFDDFLKGLPRGFQLFTLLHSNPVLLSLLVRILSAAPRLARVITRRPHVFDGLLEPGFFDASPTREQFHDGLMRSLQQARNYEDGLDRARIYADEQRFLIGIRVLSEAIPPKAAGTAYAMLAEVMLQAMVDWVRVPFEEAHGCVPGANFCILGMGNLGSSELTASSDLDLIFVYEYDPGKEESDGAKSLHASQYYGRFTQRLISAMSAPTSEGIIYELDFRLRPSGNSGPIATSLRAFDQYYADSAWTWELFALTRARPVAGDAEFAKKVDQSVARFISASRDEAALAKDIYEMRELMDEERPAQDLWDVKLSAGGLVDIEFVAQFSVLTGIAKRGGTTALVIEALKGQTLHNDNVTLSEAYSIYSDVIQLTRICLEKSLALSEAPKGFIELMMKVLDVPDAISAEKLLKDTQTSVREYFLEKLAR